MAEDQLRNCPICFGPYQDPRELACRHILCRQCAQKIADAASGSFKCPLCRFEHINFTSADALPGISPLLKSFLDSAAEQMHCQNCSNLVARIQFMHCKRCSKSLCTSCCIVNHSECMYSKHIVKFDQRFLEETERIKSEISNCTTFFENQKGGHVLELQSPALRSTFEKYLTIEFRNGWGDQGTRIRMRSAILQHGKWLGLDAAVSKALLNYHKRSIFENFFVWTRIGGASSSPHCSAEVMPDHYVEVEFYMSQLSCRNVNQDKLLSFLTDAATRYKGSVVEIKSKAHKKFGKLWSCICGGTGSVQCSGKLTEQLMETRVNIGDQEFVLIYR